MKTIRVLALFAGTLFLLTPVAHAQQKDPFSPYYFSIMLGVADPENTSLKSDAAFFLVQGRMVNPYFGFQVDLGGVSVSDNNDVVTKAEAIGVSLKLAIPVAFIEPYLLTGAGLDVYHWGFPVHAAFGINFNFDALQVGVEARQVWYETDGLNLDSLLLMEKISLRF